MQNTTADPEKSPSHGPLIRCHKSSQTLAAAKYAIQKPKKTHRARWMARICPKINMASHDVSLLTSRDGSADFAAMCAYSMMHAHEL
jgi:hypothetical protein